MGVRPPDAGSDSEPEVIEFGIAAVDARLDEAGVSFPATAAAVIEALGDTEIPYDAHGNSISVRAAVEATDKTEFTDRNELLNALHFVSRSSGNGQSDSSTGSVRCCRSESSAVSVSSRRVIRRRCSRWSETTRSDNTPKKNS